MHARICLNSRQSVSEQLKSLETIIVSLDMSFLHLGNLPIDEIEQYIDLIPPSVQYLNLGTNKLHNLSARDLDQFCVVLSKKTNLRYVSLHHNALGSVNTEDLLSAIVKLSSDNLIAFDLGHNEFWRKASVEWRCLFSSKPLSTLVYLNLSGNFMLTHGDQLIQKIMSVPLSVLRLSLALNQLGEKKAKELSGLLRAVSPTIKVLDIQKNALHHLAVDVLSELESALPSIETLFVTSGEINRMSYAQLDAFAKLLPACKQMVTINRVNKIVSSDKINYLQAKLNAGKVLGVQNMPSALFASNHHDAAMFLSDSDGIIGKLRRVVRGKDCTRFFNRLTDCVNVPMEEFPSTLGRRGS